MAHFSNIRVYCRSRLYLFYLFYYNALDCDIAFCTFSKVVSAFFTAFFGERTTIEAKRKKSGKKEKAKMTEEKINRLYSVSFVILTSSYK
jgi:hypothetical protein